MKKAVIFDLNGVFIVSPKLSDRFRDELNIPQDYFLPALKNIMARVRQPGAPTLFSLWKPFFAEWAVTLDEKGLEEFWFSAEKENEDMVKLAKDLKAKGIKLFILSNNFRERGAYYETHFPFIKELFEKAYFSWQTGFVKPDRGGFELILRENNLAPEDCVYLDDNEGNVEAALEMGITAYLFKDDADTRQLLKPELS